MRPLLLLSVTLLVLSLSPVLAAESEIMSEVRIVPSLLLEVAASETVFPTHAQVRSVSFGRRRMVPYGGFSMTNNPYRRPNSPRDGNVFFSPRSNNAFAWGQPAAWAQANLQNHHPGLAIRRPFGVDAYTQPFAYYTPPPFVGGNGDNAATLNNAVLNAQKTE